MAEPPSPYDRAVRLLAARPHFARELAVKLARRGYAEAEVADALARLAERGYLDDRAFARDRVTALLARGGLGRARLEADLLGKGCPPEVAAEVLAELVPEDDLPAARRAAAAWRRRGGASAPSLARHLDRKGFSRRAIFAVLEEMGEGPASGEEE